MKEIKKRVQTSLTQDFFNRVYIQFFEGDLKWGKEFPGDIVDEMSDKLKASDWKVFDRKFLECLGKRELQRMHNSFRNCYSPRGCSKEVIIELLIEYVETTLTMDVQRQWHEENELNASCAKEDCEVCEEENNVVELPTEEEPEFLNEEETVNFLEYVQAYVLESRELRFLNERAIDDCRQKVRDVEAKVDEAITLIKDLAAVVTGTLSKKMSASDYSKQIDKIEEYSEDDKISLEELRSFAESIGCPDAESKLWYRPALQKAISNRVKFLKAIRDVSTIYEVDHNRAARAVTISEDTGCSIKAAMKVI